MGQENGRPKTAPAARTGEASAPLPTTQTNEHGVLMYQSTVMLRSGTKPVRFRDGVFAGVDALLPLLSVPVSACAGDSWARALASTLTSVVARASAPVSPSVSVSSLASVGNGSASGVPAF